MLRTASSLTAGHTRFAGRLRAALPVAAALAAAVSSSCILAPDSALAAAPAGTSVTLQSVSHGALAGSVGSAKASCVSDRVVRLEIRKHHKWVTRATTRSNASGHFTVALHGARAGHYRVVVTAAHLCTSAHASKLTISHSAPVASKPAGSGATATPPSSSTSSTPAGTPSTPAGTPSAPAATPSAPSSPAGTTTPAPQPPACSLPLAQDSVDGFQIGVPSGWELLTLHGQLEVAPNPLADTGVVIIPAAQTSGLSSTSYFQSELSTLGSELGNSVTVTGNGTQGGQPTVTFTEQSGGETIEGTATVVVRQNLTQAGSSELDFVAEWAPQSSFGTQSSTLSAIVNCYSPEPGSLYQVYQDQAFTYLEAPGWHVSAENQDQLVLEDASQDLVTYQEVGGTPSQFTTPQSLINLILSDYAITSVSPIWSNPQGSSSGATDFEEFTGTYQGTPVHGLMFAYTQTNSADSTGYYRLMASSAASWNALNGTMIQMAGSIQHNFTQDLQTLNQLNQQWQSFSGQVANFDDTLNNQQLVQDPTTGKLYDAPYSSYSDGSQGPGYYLNGQLLNQVQH